MSKKIIGISLVGMLLFAAPAFAQGQGDLNCNGFVDVADLTAVINILEFPCQTTLIECWRQNGDVDGDGWPLTIGDMYIIPHFLIGGYGSFPPEFSSHPESDTIMIESVTASPGETISLPVWINTVDTLVAIQFWIEMDTNYVEFDSMVVYDELPLRQFNCDGNLYSYSLFPGYDDPIVFLPGNYHIADIIINIKLENDRPVTTYLSFSSAPQRALYSGFANYFFFQPVMVDAEIQIVP
jgi:hypothetical protein